MKQLEQEQLGPNFRGQRSLEIIFMKVNVRIQRIINGASVAENVAYSLTSTYVLVQLHKLVRNIQMQYCTKMKIKVIVKELLD
jgi:hypothetical protein